MGIEQYLDYIITDSLDKKNNLGWNKDELMRYVYILLGKRIFKSKEFFLTIEEKMGVLGLSSDEINSIHHNDNDYEVTCLVTAKMLTYIYNKIGIESKIVPTVKVYNHNAVDNKVVDIQHYFVVATGEKDKKYFMTLNNDLGNIQSGFKTQFFATKLDYYNDDGVQVYEGDEIDYSVMSNDELYKIDKKIGYLTSIFDVNGEKFDYVRINSVTSNDVYIQNLIDLDENNFYNNYINLFEKFDKYNISELTEEELFIIKEYICNSINNLIYNILKERNFSFDESIYNEFNEYIKNGEFKILLVKMKSFLKQFRIDAKSEVEMFANPYAIISYTERLIRNIDDFKMCKQNMEAKKKIASNYRNSLRDLSRFFISKKRLIRNNRENTQYFSNSYLCEKFVVMFSKIFEPGIATSFSEMGFLEQNDIIKRYYTRIFSYEFSSQDKLWERVLYSIIYSKDDSDDYRVLFGFYNSDFDDLPIFVMYSPKNNQLDVDVDILLVSSKFNILSKTFREKLKK